MNTICLISEQEAYAHLAQPYNPPALTKDFLEEDFYHEWHTVQKGLAKILNQFWENDAYGQGDYYIADSATLSRGINVCITSAKPLGDKIILLTQSYLMSLKFECEVDYTISTKDGDFEIFVSKDKVQAWCPLHIREKLAIESGNSDSA